MTPARQRLLSVLAAAAVLAFAATGWVWPRLARANLAGIDPPGNAEPAALERVVEDRAGTLRNRYAELLPQLEQSPFHRPLHLESAAGSRASQGDVYARVDQSIAKVSGALANPDYTGARCCRSRSAGK